ncbi:vesicle transport v-SNARE 13 isoform X2 [Physcomitrium patens]|uniref:Vesicle transport v-SNARE N-terminal domain-containing protein n=1 Tax=Physcomitrium patens TaxID=3218 RepID=A0A7I4D6I9_PHYPA|nr:vesicle transport v-SNARE 13-like isoform X2 [Physcomitrium patens]|eukprot:XP_024359443.1 vesicle transport v-SNARE 13-like isoform X2 [Physcomitrella patens]
MATRGSIASSPQISTKSAIQSVPMKIKRMDLEARTLPPAQKATLLAKLREYKSDLNVLKREAKKILASNDPFSARDELLNPGLVGRHLGPGLDQRDRLMMATDRMNQTGERIKESRRQLNETEEVGVNILQDLQLQHQTLLHTQHTIHGVADGIAKSRRLLSSLSQRFERHKYIMGGIIAVCLLAILFIMHVKSGH